LKPDHADARLNLGNLLFDAGNLEQAEAVYRRVLDFSPNLVDAHNNLGNVFREQGRLDESIDAYNQALVLKPEHVEGHSNLGEALKDAGRIDEAVACYRRALELKPDFAAVHSNLLLALQYQAGATLAGLSAAHSEYERLHAQPLQTVGRVPARTADGERRLKVGFVSPDFCHHPVAYFLIRAFENIDRDQWETVCASADGGFTFVRRQAICHKPDGRRPRRLAAALRGATRWVAHLTPNRAATSRSATG
jgi:tetratricopeptide (TPR) repeat protein